MRTDNATCKVHLHWLFALAVLIAALVPLRAAETTLISTNSDWKYWNRGDAPTNDWKTLDYDASAWKSGPGKLGYGGDGEATVTEGATLNPHPISAYFRHVFTVEDPTALSTLVIRLVRDDGAVVYLNGRELFRSNMPDGVITPTTLAPLAIGAPAESQYLRFEGPADGLLRTNENILAVEVHQAAATSSDLGFDLQLIGLAPSTTTNPVVSIVATQAETSEPNPAAKILPGKFTISRTGSLDSSLAVFLKYGGTANIGVDYEGLQARVVIPAGSESTSILVEAKSDDLEETNETVIATLALPPINSEFKPYSINPEHGSATVTIANYTKPAPEFPIISIDAPRPSTSEPIPGALMISGLFTVHRAGRLDTPVSVFLGYSGTATSGADYRPLPNPVLFSAGQTEARLEVSALADDLKEGDETVVAEVSQPPTAGAALTYLIDTNANRAVVTIHDTTPIAKAHIEITEPTNGQTFQASAPIPITAVATDPAGYISRVEFYSEDVLIGVSDITFIVAPPPGEPITHNFTWTNAPAGSHTLRARGGGVVSAPVTITVLPSTNRIRLALEVTDAEAAEPGATGAVNTASFTIKRVAGPTNVAVVAHLSIGGTASNGVDYNQISSEVDIPAGQSSASVQIVPKADNLVEGPETVLLTLTPPPCAAIFPPPPDCYDVVVGIVPAKITILDSTSPTNHPPVAHIARPAAGSVFTVGQSIEIVAEASDSDGSIARLEILADGNVLGAAATNRLVVHWTNAPAGEHLLTAHAVDNSGAESTSGPTKILVREKNAGAFVFRNLPDAYTPGTAFKVELRAEPPSSARAYAVQDRPPTGWSVTNISNDGFYDPATGKVKFGPFTDATNRTLSYEITPPANATGRREFAGEGSIDGVSYPIGGDQAIEQGATVHPADSDKNFAIVVDELTAYAAAWKGGATNWPAGPTPIPLTYVTRAGFIWKHGEAYKFDGSKAAPLCWVPTQPATAPLAADGAVAASERSGEGLVHPGASMDIQIKITPPTATTAYAVEEHIPTGWAVTNISNDGKLEAGVIRWGIFLDNTARTLTYTVTPPTNGIAIGRLEGKVSFDGETREITGRERLISIDEPNRPHLGHCERDTDGKVHVRLEGSAGQVGVVQRSTNLLDWEDVTTIYLPDGALDFTDETSAGGEMLYYRLQVR